MESYTDLDLYLQFVCFFRNERLYIDRSDDKTKQKLTNILITD